jgi:hypothetical protein
LYGDDILVLYPKATATEGKRIIEEITQRYESYKEGDI